MAIETITIKKIIRGTAHVYVTCEIRAKQENPYLIEITLPATTYYPLNTVIELFAGTQCVIIESGVE